MTEEKTQSVKNQALRNNEYYVIQKAQDDLYQRLTKNLNFSNLMSLIESEDNTMLAYRNIKANKGSLTPAADNTTIRDVETHTKEEFLTKMDNLFRNYQPRVVRRKEIPKPNGKTRPLGIPSIWDRLVQQCILQILEPICEAKFIKDSYDFRPNRSAENAVAKCVKHINLTKLHYVVDVDIKGFFDEVSHTKLLRQLWTLGVRDKRLLVIIRKILEAPILIPDSTICYPDKGTPQGGILSPLLANVTLNEFDHWIENQWATRKLPNIKHSTRFNGNDYSNELRYLRRKTTLKPMYIVRYADDFKIFTNNRSNAEKIFKASAMWLEERLKLPISLEKSRVTNLKKESSEFLGFTLKARKKGKKRVAETHIASKAIQRVATQLRVQIKNIQRTGNGLQTLQEINKYNFMIMVIHNYYGIANQINLDLGGLNRQLDIVMYNRFQKANRRLKENSNSYSRFGKYEGKDKGLLKYIKPGMQSMRYYMKRPILPIGDIKARNPMQKKQQINKYTKDGRKEIHKNLKGITEAELNILRKVPLGTGQRGTIQLYDNRIALYIAQKGKCAISGQDLIKNMHVHHKTLWSETHDDSYENLVLITNEVHKLVHAMKKEIIEGYLAILKLNSEQITKLEKLRKLVGNPTLKSITQNV